VDGSIWMMSTPWGKRGFFYRAATSNLPGWERIEVSAEESGRFSQEWLDEERDGDQGLGPLWFSQEYEGKFVDTSESMFSHDAVLDAISPDVEQALLQMMAQQEPYPLTVLDGAFTIVRSNQAASAVFGAFVAEPQSMPEKPDMFSLVFDPRLLRTSVLDWETLARTMMGRQQRELLQRGGDARLEALLARTLALPDVPAAFQHADFSQQPEPTQTVRLSRGEHSVNFLIAVTAFASQTQVTLEELRVESCFPLDEATRRTCQRLAEQCAR